VRPSSEQQSERSRHVIQGHSRGPQLKTAFGCVFVANEGFTPETAAAALAAGEADAVHRQSRPAAPHHARNAPLNRWNSATFYSQGEEGYTDYSELAEAAESLLRRAGAN
jgi:2,4-dienoyl-CoA reductase-like NADH-dependent reductase (Old Yellow Enzyme family)